MCSELFRIPMSWGDVPIFGFGVLLALWCVGGVALVLYVRRRPDGEAEAWSYLPAIVVGAVVIALLPKFLPAGIPIRGYGVMVLMGSLTGLWMVVEKAKWAGLRVETIHAMAFWMFVLGIVGARLFFVIEYWEDRYSGGTLWHTLKEAAMYTEGGLVVYGSLAGGTLAFLVLTRRYKIPTLAMADLIAPALVAGLALGRLGCLLNGCCYGGESDVPWAVTFPSGSLAYVDQASHGELHGLTAVDNSGRVEVSDVREGSVAAEAGLAAGDVVVAVEGYVVPNAEDLGAWLASAAVDKQALQITTSDGERHNLEPPQQKRSRPVHPTQVYSAVNAGLLTWLLWSFYPLRRHDGEVICLLLILYPIARFLLEVIRVDEAAVFGTQMSISQNISIVVLACSVTAWVWLQRQPAGRLAFPLAKEGA